MSIESPGNAKEIFLAAVEMASASDRESFLNRACGGDELLRKRVDALLVAHERPGDLLDHGAPDLDQRSRTEATIDAEQAGTEVGPYKLRERLGAGGMGVVWAAEQIQPLRRRVALKVIKPGMDSEQVLARFATEREALARMDHPNIARVLDAGTTAQGRPYFVMELIRGAPITEYCDANRMTIRQRLGLFTQVCKAVQHAHQKGVVHRDIKPSNVLVSEQDGEAIVKVIDFGVAKALFQVANEHSAYSGVFQAIGTLAYMSPEQAGLSVSDIDTRADVYSLGVLLYELVTGVTPLDKKQLQVAALDEAFRIIREHDPPKPSTRASSLGQGGRHVAHCRQTDANGLRKSIRGDLDWIVMKCLDKDRKRRYDTPSALGEDVERFLNDQEITARPPAPSYRFRKMLRRNRATVLTVTLLFALLGASSGLGWISYLNLRRAQLSALVDSARQREMLGDYTAAADKYQAFLRLQSRTENEADLVDCRAGLGRVLIKLKQLSQAEEHFGTASAELGGIANDAERQAAASRLRDDLAQAADEILGQTATVQAGKAAALRLALAADELSMQYDLKMTVQLYSVLTRSKYENRLYRRAISRCLQWASDENVEASYLTYLILSAAFGQLGNLELACEWMLASENHWFAVTITERARYASLRSDVQRFTASLREERSSRLNVEEQLTLYARLLERYPDNRGMRKYHGYCLFQLGRWREAKSDFESLLARRWTNVYSVVPEALLSLFFEPNSFTPARAEELSRRVFEASGHYNVSALAIVAMLADREGRLVNEELYNHVHLYPVAAGLVLYRANRLDEAYGLLRTHGGLFPARDVLAEIIRGLIEWQRGKEEEAQASLERAERTIERLAPRVGVPRTNEDIGFATSVIWLEPLLLLREAREKIPRRPGTDPHPIDESLHPETVR